MSTKNHTKSMSQPERAFWRDVYLVIARLTPVSTADQEGHAEICATYADAALAQYRNRVTWRNT